MFKDLITLFFPEYCPACNTLLGKQEQGMCLRCFYNLPRTHYHNFRDNPLEQLLWGRINIDKGSAYYFYKKSSPYQELIHDLKYNSNLKVGEFLGANLARENKAIYKAADLIIPVPLHPKKLKIRGYNQSEVIAKAMATELGIPLCTNVLKRNWHSASQTRKGKTARWENVANIFSLNDPEIIRNKKLLLVDDVITTGSTIEACANELSKATPQGILIGSLAFAIV